MLEHAGLQIGALDVGRRQVVVEVVVVEGEVYCSADGSMKTAVVVVVVKRYQEPMAHGPEACEPSHPCGSR